MLVEQYGEDGEVVVEFVDMSGEDMEGDGEGGYAWPIEAILRAAGFDVTPKTASAKDGDKDAGAKDADGEHEEHGGQGQAKRREQNTRDEL